MKAVKRTLLALLVAGAVVIPAQANAFCCGFGFGFGFGFGGWGGPWYHPGWSVPLHHGWGGPWGHSYAAPLWHHPVGWAGAYDPWHYSGYDRFGYDSDAIVRIGSRRYRLIYPTMTPMGPVYHYPSDLMRKGSDD